MDASKPVLQKQKTKLSSDVLNVVFQFGVVMNNLKRHQNEASDVALSRIGIQRVIHITGYRLPG